MIRATPRYGCKTLWFASLNDGITGVASEAADVVRR